jgi:hypothetical protein
MTYLKFNIKPKGMRVIKTKMILFFCVCAILSLTQCSSGAKKELLKIEVPWAQRTEEQKLIGVWCSSTFEPHGRTIATNSLSFKTVIYFYNDGTMQRYFESNVSLGSGELMEEGTHVKITNGKLQYLSSKFGNKEYPISITENSLNIKGSANEKLTRCQ